MLLGAELYIQWMLSHRISARFRKGGFEKIWKMVKGGFIGFTVKTGVCVKGVSKIKRVGSDIVHQCTDYYFILSMIYVLK